VRQAFSRHSVSVRPPISDGNVCSIIFDGDDTLWRTESLYDSARAKARELVSASGLDGEEWEEMERKVDVQRVGTQGFSKDRFPGSCLWAYHQIATRDGTPVDPLVAKRIRLAAQEVFFNHPQLMPDSAETLEHLRCRGFPLALITKGDAQVQRRRVKQSGLAGYFDTIIVVPHKSPRLISQTVLSLGADPSRSWMIGNSIRSDVIPALKAGLRAIWLNSHVWEYERVENFVHERVTPVHTLLDVLSIISPLNVR
jgi:putative hydrolase of the HAD superfamily